MGLPGTRRSCLNAVNTPTMPFFPSSFLLCKISMRISLGGCFFALIQVPVASNNLFIRDCQAELGLVKTTVQPSDLVCGC